MESVFRLRRELCFLAGRLRRGRRGVSLTGGGMGRFIVSAIIGGINGTTIFAGACVSRGTSLSTDDVVGGR